MNQDAMNNYLEMMNSSGIQPTARQRQSDNSNAMPADFPYARKAQNAGNAMSDVSPSSAIKQHEADQNVEELDMQETMNGNMYGNAHKNDTASDMAHGNMNTAGRANTADTMYSNMTDPMHGNNMNGHMSDEMYGNYVTGRTADAMYGNGADNDSAHSMHSNTHSNTMHDHSYDDDNMVQMCMREALASNVGEYIVAEFEMCDGKLMRKQGILYNVGADFITLYDDNTKTYTLCDYCNIRFVTYYQSGQRPSRAQPTRK